MKYRISISLILFLTVSLIYSCNESKTKTMEQNNEKTEAGLKRAVQKLITPDKDFGVKDLDAIYHDDMIVIIIDDQDNKQVFNKKEFIKIIESKLKTDESENNKWVKFHHVEVNQNKGLTIMTRKVNLTGEKRKLHVSIDYVWESNRWQITREHLYSQPLQ